MTRRLATIQDLSCIGRCSLAVAMSVVPAMGIETAVLPTAILSAHTAFDNFTFLDFSDEADKIMRHWAEMQLKFDAIYIGYLGSLRLIALAERFLSLFHTPETRVILDPAFGDNGRLYTGFDAEYVRAMRRLCERAELLLPNATEVRYLLNLPEGAENDREALRTGCEKLLGGTLQNILITSCPYPDGRTGICCVGRDAFDYAHERLPLFCHGSGDLFASVFSGGLTLGLPVRAAAMHAADFVHDAVRHSMQAPDHRWYGVDYETLLPELAQKTRRLIESN